MTLGTLLAGELRHHLRDPATLLLTAVLPGLLYPLGSFAFLDVVEKERKAAEEKAITVAVVGEVDRIAPFVPDKVTLVPAGEDPRADLAAGRTDAVLALPERDAPFRASVTYDTRNRGWSGAEERATDAARALGEAERAARFRTRGATVAPEALLRVDTDNVVPKEARQLRSAAAGAPALLLLMVSLGGIYTAVDVVTGEKERGTLETLLVTAVDRRLVLLAKFLVVLLFVLFSGAVSLGALALTGARAFGEAAVAPASVGLAALLFLPLAALLAMVFTGVAARVPDFKSGQAYALPAMLIPPLLAAAAMIPGIRLTPLVALVPFANLAVAFRDLLTGQAQASALLLVGLSSTAWAGVTLWAGARWLGREDVLLGAHGSAHRRLRGDYAPDALGVMAVALCSFWFIGMTLQKAHLLGGLLATQYGLFVPLAVGAVAWLGLPLRETLGLRVPALRDLGWAALAGLLAPGLAVAVVRVQSVVLPMSPEWAKAFSEALTLDQPLPVVLLALALTPGVCEELLFRGTLLGLLRRSMGPVAAVAWTAAAFGLMHASVFRILPTAVLGLLLGAIRVRSGSLVPAVVAHAFVNACGLTLLADSDGQSPWLILAGVGAVVAVSRIGR